LAWQECAYNQVVLVVLEGIDGSGKGTQTKLLFERALREGISAAHITFPQYGKNPFALAVSEYLNGAFGGVDEVHPRLSSLLFAGDRFASKGILMEALASHELVILDRYIASNLAHQAAKLPESERAAFIGWLEDIEFGAYQMPHPVLTLFLDVPLEAARKMVHLKSRQEGAYTQLKEDIHEQDADYLSRCQTMYEYLIERSIAGPWVRLDCADAAGNIRSQDDIAEEIWTILMSYGG
jgi:dTMP kinase